MLVAGGVIVALNGPSGRSPCAASRSGSGRPRGAVLTVTAELRPVEVERSISINGSVFAWQEVIIAPEVGGYRVAEVKVDVGDRVKRGQTLVELSTALLDAEVATKKATFAQREAQLVTDAAALERGDSLKSMNLISQADYDKLKSAALVSRAGVESAKADVDTSQLRLKFTNVTAPDDGVITARTVTVGQIASRLRNAAPPAQRPHRMARRGAPRRLSSSSLGTRLDLDGRRRRRHGQIRVVAPTIQAATAPASSTSTYRRTSGCVPACSRAATSRSRAQWHSRFRSRAS